MVMVTPSTILRLYVSYSLGIKTSTSVYWLEEQGLVRVWANMTSITFVETNKQSKRRTTSLKSSK